MTNLKKNNIIKCLGMKAKEHGAENIIISRLVEMNGF